MAAGSFVFAIMGTLVRAAADVPGLTHADVTFVRFAFGLAVTHGAARFTRTGFRIVNVPWFVTRGVLGGVTVLLFYYAIQTVGLAKATTLNYTFLLWVSLLSPVIAHDRVQPKSWLAVILACGGVYLLLAPSGGLAGANWQDGIALVSGLSAGIAILSIRRLIKTDSPLMVFYAQCFFGVLMVAYPALRDLRLGPSSAWGLLAAIGVVTTTGQWLMTLAYRDINGQEGALMSVITPVASAVLGVWLFNEPVTTRIVGGSVLVLVACAYAAYLGFRPVRSPVPPA